MRNQRVRANSVHNLCSAKNFQLPCELNHDPCVEGYKSFLGYESELPPCFSHPRGTAAKMGEYKHSSLTYGWYGNKSTSRPA